MKTNLTGRRRLRTNTKPVNSFNHDELEVAQIMLSLPDLIPEFDNRNKENIPPEISRWRCKRQRSAIDYDNHNHVGIILPPPPSSLPSLEKPKFRSLKKKKDPKKSRKELEEQLDELTERKKNIERARIFYEEQKALNFRLKEFIKSNDELQSFVNRRLNLVRQENDDDHEDAKEEDDDDDDRYNDKELDGAEEEEEEENGNDANDDG